MGRSSNHGRSIVSVCIFLITCIIGIGECLAHRDMRVTVEDDGTLVGIPSEYGPAALHVAFASSTHGPPISAIVLDLGKNHTRVPECVTSLLTTRTVIEIRASASWYHDESVLPYYLNLEFFGPGYDKSAWANSGHELLFDLRTGKLLQMQALVVLEAGKTLQFVPVALAARCSPAELKELLSSDFDRLRRRKRGTVTTLGE